MGSFTIKNISFKKIESKIKPVASIDINKHTACFYENPALVSTDNFELDILRYALKCIYTKEVLFPCSFNTFFGDETIWNMFFDGFLKVEHKRENIKKLASCLYQHNLKNEKYIFKALSIFEKSPEFNCIRASYENGETFIVATRNIKKGEIITISDNFIIPRIDDDDKNIFRLMSGIKFSDMSIFNKILKSRKDASRLLPDVPVYNVTNCMDCYLKNINNSAVV